jgi:hypothetical protein
MQPFFAFIIPATTEAPQPPLGIWGGANQPFPTPPISGMPGLPGYFPPLGFWGGRPPPYVDIGFPQPPPGIWGPYPGFPTQPIAPGGTTPPWGINVPIYPSQGPGFPTNPIAGIPGLPGFMPPPDISQPPQEGVKPPPSDGGWGYSPEYGWGYFPPADEARPKGSSKTK